MTLSRKGALPGGNPEDDSWQTFTSHFQVELNASKQPSSTLNGSSSNTNYLSTVIKLDRPAMNADSSDGKAPEKYRHRVTESSICKPFATVVSTALSHVNSSQFQVEVPNRRAEGTRGPALLVVQVLIFNARAL